MKPESSARYLTTSAAANITRNLHVQQATPPWANLEAIAAVYAEAVRLSAQHGVRTMSIT
jgi:DMSO/TMAO reductase YedYZ molybdopterin-dependent catalytic subunit